MQQPRSIRTNNPGALDYGPFARRHGAIGTDGRLAVFPNVETGYRAQEALLGTYADRHGLTTPRGIINRWAPPGNADRNSTGQYINFVSQRLGVSPDTPIGPEMRPKLAEVMAAYEAGQPVNRSGLSAAYAMPQGQGKAQMPLGDASGGSWLDRITSNPLFLMGAGVLGAPNIGQGIMQGVQASSEMKRASAAERKNAELFPLQKQLMESQLQRANTADSREAEILPLQKQLLEAQVKKASQPPTSADITEFQYAKGQGYEGDFTDWMATKKNAAGGIYGKQGAIMQGQDGNFYAVQFGGDGSMRTHKVRGPDGRPMTPAKGVMQVGDEVIDRSTAATVRGVAPQIAGEERAKVAGRTQGQAVADLPKAESLHKTVTQYIDSVMNDPNLDSMLGYRGYMPNVSPASRTMQSKIDQLSSYGFLQAFESLKGAGAITEREGEAATKAYSRLREMVQSGQDYRGALKDFRGEMDRMLGIARSKAGGGGQSAPARTQRYKFNPTTGELE